jgi:predicted RNase H-like HicB family nuclease
MLDFKDVKVEDFGKVIFVPKNHAIPALPDMNLIVFNRESGYQAVCIDIEIDAVGDNLKECCNNLKQALLVYIEQMVDNYNGNINAAVKDIVNVSYSKGELKSQLFTRYLEAKHQYLLNRIAKENKAKSRTDELINAWKRIFQFEPIRFNLAMAAVFT